LASHTPAAVEELLPYPTPLYEGEGLNFDLVAATGSYEYSEAWADSIRLCMLLVAASRAW
jgi:hypothetical protein